MLQFGEIPGTENPADLCTKGLPSAKNDEYCDFVKAYFIEGRSSIASKILPSRLNGHITSLVGSHGCRALGKGWFYTPTGSYLYPPRRGGLPAPSHKKRWENTASAPVWVLGSLLSWICWGYPRAIPYPASDGWRTIGKKCQVLKTWRQAAERPTAAEATQFQVQPEMRSAYWARGEEYR